MLGANQDLFWKTLTDEKGKSCYFFLWKKKINLMIEWMIDGEDLMRSLLHTEYLFLLADEKRGRGQSQKRGKNN